MDVVRNNFYEERWWRGGAEVAEPGNPSCVDRSSTFCRPVDKRSGADSKEERERGKGERKSRDFGAEVSLSPNGAKTKVFIG